MDYVSAWAARKFAGLLTAFWAVSWRFWFDLANKPVNVRPLVAMSRALEPSGETLEPGKEVNGPGSRSSRS